MSVIIKQHMLNNNNILFIQGLYILKQIFIYLPITKMEQTIVAQMRRGSNEHMYNYVRYN